MIPGRINAIIGFQEKSTIHCDPISLIIRVKKNPIVELGSTETSGRLRIVSFPLTPLMLLLLSVVI